MFLAEYPIGAALEALIKQIFLNKKNYTPGPILRNIKNLTIEVKKYEDWKKLRQ